MPYPSGSWTHSLSPRCSGMMPELEADPAHLPLARPADDISALPDALGPDATPQHEQPELSNADNCR